jgi:hypothetical protein
MIGASPFSPDPGNRGSGVLAVCTGATINAVHIGFNVDGCALQPVDSCNIGLSSK